jgi:thiamine biosynthesis lipoprotein
MQTASRSTTPFRLHWPGLSYQHSACFEGVLGTRLDVRISARNAQGAHAAETVLLAETDRLERIFSRYDPTSELNALLRSQGWVSISPELHVVLTAAQHWMQVSGGAFHPGADALVTLWRSAEASANIPTTAQLEAVLEHLRQAPFELNGPRVRTCFDQLNLNAIAKGFIADRACQAALEVDGVTDVLVNFGGDLRHTGRAGRNVSIANPFSNADNAAPIATVHIRNQAVATSGSARRGFRVSSQWYSHVLDPRSGLPVNRTVSVSVIAPDAITADALATVFSVLEPAASLELADSITDVACLIVSPDRQVLHNRRWPSPL